VDHSPVIIHIHQVNHPATETQCAGVNQSKEKNQFLNSEPTGSRGIQRHGVDHKMSETQKFEWTKWGRLTWKKSEPSSRRNPARWSGPSYVVKTQLPSEPGMDKQPKTISEPGGGEYSEEKSEPRIGRNPVGVSKPCNYSNPFL